MTLELDDGRVRVFPYVAAVPATSPVIQASASAKNSRWADIAVAFKLVFLKRLTETICYYQIVQALA